MQIGAMNNPMTDVVEEIESYAACGFDFIDLTLEPQMAYSATFPIARVQQALARTGLGVVGHTAYYLPIAAAIPEIRSTIVPFFVAWYIQLLSYRAISPSSCARVITSSVRYR
jgi:sugar phosphate isomerase/epimerase